MNVLKLLSNPSSAEGRYAADVFESINELVDIFDTPESKASTGSVADLILSRVPDGHRVKILMALMLIFSLRIHLLNGLTSFLSAVLSVFSDVAESAEVEELIELLDADEVGSGDRNLIGIVLAQAAIHFRMRTTAMQQTKMSYGAYSAMVMDLAIKYAEICLTYVRMNAERTITTDSEAIQEINDHLRTVVEMSQFDALQESSTHANVRFSTIGSRQTDFDTRIRLALESIVNSEVQRGSDLGMTVDTLMTHASQIALTLPFIQGRALAQPIELRENMILRIIDKAF